MFERLTRWENNDKDMADLREGKSDFDGLTEAINRLAAYEDSGLSPEEVQKLKKSDASKEQCTIDQHGEIHRLRDELKRYKQAEQEGRLKILPAKPGDINAVPVVRCVECKNFSPRNLVNFCARTGRTCEPNDYCSYGERKKNDERD